ncbi:MAG TPA: TlpA disulfide reductase family protein [Actinomycetota bacterium]|jgi:thiol-disulfide isomerase/thioredoxin|nr:TlpA disulfide reductase family protein [Actinomycetota bacterium]
MRRQIALLLIAAAGLTACGREAAAPRGSPPSVSQTERLLPSNRLALPQYDLATFRTLLSELRGTPVVVNVWGSWCPPCMAEAPDLSAVSKEFEGRVQFLGIDILDEREAARDFILKYDWQYPHVFDPRGEIRDGLGYIGQPVTVIYDRSGAVAFEWNGVITAERLRKGIRKVV